ncbi:FG-GAP-like repeat-containing protein [Streptomyces sp. NPDC048361]|uniref:FG-GAP-like repeat-containing protein n=1 Tax=Streptomyces sp. NPDC048361 TaxID=3154720 RepID=UPI00341E2D96
MTDGSLSEEDNALQLAKSAGEPYELTSARTESSDTWALPDGTWKVKRYGTPVRMLRDGAWIPTDPSLVFASDGSVAPKASTVAVTFSGGGSAPLLSGVKDGRALTLSWPKPLPKPTLNQNVATYAEVLPGVDLQLKAEVEGFSQLLVVKTAAAAKNPDLASLKYTLGTVGLNVSTDATTGSLTAVNPAGETVFTSPTPLMWDSTTATSAPSGLAVKSALAPAADAAGAADAGETPADAFDPAAGARDAQMPTTVSGSTLEIKPDQQLLTGADTKYPVFIDPSWAWGQRQNWTRVYQKYPGTSFWNAKDVVRVGYENETNGLSRSFFQMDTSNIKGTQVKSSTFRIRNVWSWSCQARPVELWSVGGISSKTTWNNQPAKYNKLYTVNDAKGWQGSDDCPAGNLEFDATAKVREAASKNWASLNLGLYASDEKDTFGWKKFDPKTATLETVYNNPPSTPSGLGTSPRTSCASGGLIGNTRVSMYAKFDDPDGGNLTAQFQVFPSGSTTPIPMSVPAAKGKVSTWAVPDDTLPTGGYTWRARTVDSDGAASAWSETCKFSVDRTRPSKPPVISSSDGKFPNGEAGWPSPTGKAHDTGTFSFASNGVTDVAKYVWWTDCNAQIREVDPGIPASVQPPGYGPHFVYAYSVDKAGNRSDIATYVYYANRNKDRDALGDLNGDGNRDIWSVDSNGTLLTYAGQGNGQFAAATNGGNSFDGAQVGSAGGWTQENYNDLVALENNTADKRKGLWVYPNNGEGAIGGSDRKPLSVNCPDKNPDLGCDFGDDWNGDDHWHDADQIVTPGDINNDPQHNPDLLVKEGRQLWAYYGSRSSLTLDNDGGPVLVGNGDWDKFTVIAPGDLNNDGIPDLWLRDNNSGDIYRSYGRKDPNTGKLDPTTWGNALERVKIGSGVPASTFPTVGSVGDINGDGLPDLWARKTDNTVIGWQGKAPGSDGNSFGTSFVIDGVTGGTRIPAGTTLASGKSFTSRSAKLTMQTDGNLVITSNADKVLWSTKTSGNPGATAAMNTDGNLRVYTADGTTKLWGTDLDATKTPGLTAGGYALLQDRGNLVVYNIKSQALWSSGTHIRHDYNGDGRSDMASWYNYSDGHAAFQSFLTNSDGTFNAPFGSYSSGIGSWNVDKMRFATGDYNGDGRGDAAMTYDYGGGLMKVFTAFGKPDGGFQAPVVSYTSAKGSWYSESMSLQSGDFNGDGRDDLAIWYSYADGSDRLFTLTADVRGGFNPPFEGNAMPAGWWDVKKSKAVTGDFNGDGRDDIAALYGYGDGTLKMHTFLASPTGAFQPDLTSWGSTITSWGDWNRTYLQAGDFNGDGIDDIITWYDYTDGSDAMHTLVATSNRDGKFNTPTQAWKSDPGNWDHNHMMITTGDFNGDGRDDVGAMYGYSDGTSRMFTWTTKPDGTLNGASPGYSFNTPANWSYAANTVLRPYN